MSPPSIFLNGFQINPDSIVFTVSKKKNITVFQRAVREFAPFCNEWEIQTSACTVHAQAQVLLAFL